jgi:hypothetical protein
VREILKIKRKEEKNMLRVIKFYHSDSKYPLFQRFTLSFEFRAKSPNPAFVEEIFFNVEPIYPLEFNYFGTRLIVFPFRVISNNSEIWLAYEYYENLHHGHITDILEYDNFIVTVSKDLRFGVWFGGGEFKLFRTFEELMMYYDRYDSSNEEESFVEEEYYEEEYYEEEY